MAEKPKPSVRQKLNVNAKQVMYLIDSPVGNTEPNNKFVSSEVTIFENGTILVKRADQISARSVSVDEMIAFIDLLTEAILLSKSMTDSKKLTPKK